MKGTLTKTCVKRRWINGKGKWDSTPYLVIVPAVLSNGLALHFESYGGLPCLYVVSHRGSGLAIARFHDRQRALAALKALAPLCDWDALNPESLPADLGLRVDLAIWHLLKAEELEAELEEAA